MKSIEQYKDEFVGLIRQMEQEHGFEISEVNVCVSETIRDSFGNTSKSYSVIVKG